MLLVKDVRLPDGEVEDWMKAEKKMEKKEREREGRHGKGKGTE